MDDAHALDAHAPHAAHAAHIDTSTGLDSRKMAFWGFIGSECLLFGSLIATYMAYKGRSLEGPHPHEPWVNAAGEQVPHGIFNIELTTFSTFILLMSSVAMVLALNYTQRGDRRRSALWLFLTAFGGSIFLGCQVYEFTEFYLEGMTLRSNLFSSSFFTLTGFHGAHVTVGVIYLLTLAAMAWKGKIPAEKSLNVEIAGLYWHFVDVIWIIIFPLVYLIR
ncbi:MAG TPA: cytochrome c oxidase subunit 3 [Longimicrobium sp.]|nr:cytochrome c oxidase subunit 3 [Longimicrobium sp.]